MQTSTFLKAFHNDLGWNLIPPTGSLSLLEDKLSPALSMLRDSSFRVHKLVQPLVGKKPHELTSLLPPVCIAAQNLWEQPDSHYLLSVYLVASSRARQIGHIYRKWNLEDAGLEERDLN